MIKFPLNKKKNNKKKIKFLILMKIVSMEMILINQRKWLNNQKNKIQIKFMTKILIMKMILKIDELNNLFLKIFTDNKIIKLFKLKKKNKLLFTI